MPDPFNLAPWRDALILIVQVGAFVVVLGAGAIYSLRKAFRFTDAFENEVPEDEKSRGEAGTAFPVEPSHSAPMGEPETGGRGPTVRANRIP
jgi:hypothetical protein